MKIFVISDTHGRTEKVTEVWAKLTNVDLVVHLGDYIEDARRLEKELETEVVSVKGNMDGSYNSDDYRILETEYGKLLLTHGHMDNVKMSPLNLVYRAEELGCKAVLFGHTHRPAYEEAGGIYLVNPGSLSLPRDGSDGSYAIIHTSPEEFNCAIVYYSSLSPKKKPPSGGRLRQMLNYSDRF
ncbi:metallophosphoesterase [Anaerovorax odorimutans]|uniref:Phosphoesterase n=1 Tax=Anaerovorax odorimutans TaxID=109327 RepID=A0ABT1RQW5_9FIRM|nr:metallophosphoesterase [Anaerovorax odorimutans]MCQ4637286.1 metallophosphoesterase [Anaerovorax odorimutans]